MKIDLVEAAKFVLPYYMEPHRFYHNEKHISNMINTVVEMKTQISDVQNLAILFHDVVYLVGMDKGVNEDQSVKMLDLFCDLNPTAVDQKSKILAGNIILDTVAHVACCPESKKVLDLDLYGLSLSWEEYTRAGMQIRSEYISYDDEVFYDGRIRFLQDMVDRDRIYHTDLFYEKCEFKARTNMVKEINLLKNRNND